MPRTARQKINRNKLERVHRAENKRRIRDYLYNNPCIICGYDNIFALEFDHLDPSTKKESISSLSRRAINYKHIANEIKKCQVLCTNCHRKKNSKEQSWHEILNTQNLTKDRRYKAKNILRLLDFLSNKSCVKCDEPDSVVLEFDHLDPATKIASVSNLVCVSRGWAKIKREIDKCQILCANCHKLKTTADRSIPIYIASTLDNADIVSKLGRQLEINGYPITYKWYAHGYITNKSDRIRISQLELNGVLESTIVIVLLPGGRGTHIEIGAALMSNKKVLLHSLDGKYIGHNNRHCAFYSHPRIRIVYNFDDLIPTIARSRNTK